MDKVKRSNIILARRIGGRVPVEVSAMPKVWLEAPLHLVERVRQEAELIFDGLE
jgi:hypothetical protein